MDSIINTLLRPYRSSYSLTDLGMKNCDKYARIDEAVLNDREQLIQYSYYEQKQTSDVCVIYCHCNSGSKIQGVQYLNFLIEKGWNVCLFDFSGSGLSQGQFISLGHHQAQDLHVIVKKMRQLGNKKIFLWGRSMGAATIIFYLSQAKFREDICSCILDSPYASLWDLMKQLGVEKSILPGFLIEPLLQHLRTRIKNDHGIDIKQLDTLKSIGKIDVPLLFITSKMDQFVKSEDVVQLYKQSSSKNKQLQFIDKAHNSSRDTDIIQTAVNFLHRNVEEKLKKRKPLKFFTQNSVNMTGENMADLIIKAEKQRTQLRRMKSQIFFEKDKENNYKILKKDKKAKEDKQNRRKENKNRLKTEALVQKSKILTQKDEKKEEKMTKTFYHKRKVIKFSLAHVECSKKILNATFAPQ